MIDVRRQMIDERTFLILNEFLDRVRKQTERKAELYDGVNKGMTLDRALTVAAEELGEVASAITRERIHSIKDESIDLAHCALLIYKVACLMEDT